MNSNKSIGGADFDHGKHDGAVGRPPSTSNGHYLKGYIEGKHARLNSIQIVDDGVSGPERETAFQIIEKAANEKATEAQEKLDAQIALTLELEQKLGGVEQEKHAAETKISGLEHELQSIRNQMLENTQPTSLNAESQERIQALEASIEVLKKFATHKPACALVTVTRTTRDRGPFARNTKKVCTCGLVAVLATIDNK